MDEENLKRCVVCGQLLDKNQEKFCGAKCERYFRKWGIFNYGVGKCLECGQEFIKHSPLQKYCCLNCQLEEKFRLYDSLSEERKCCDCGKSLKSLEEDFCSECIQKYFNEMFARFGEYENQVAFRLRTGTSDLKIHGTAESLAIYWRFYRKFMNEKIFDTLAYSQDEISKKVICLKADLNYGEPIIYGTPEDVAAFQVEYENLCWKDEEK